MSNLLQEAIGVMSMLGSTLPQSPSLEDAFEELNAVYQDAANELNNTGNSWSISSFTLTTVAGTRTYRLDPTQVTDFYKALLVTTIPQNSNPEYVLQFTELEALPHDWAWLSQYQGQLLDANHSSSLIAFYRQITTSGEEIWCELRPTPSQVETYKVTYQIGDWWDAVFSTAGKESSVILPNKEFKFYFRACAARNLTPKAKWSFDKVQNAAMKAEIMSILNGRIAKGEKIWGDHLMTLDNSDIVRLDSYSDIMDGYDDPLRYKW